MQYLFFAALAIGGVTLLAGRIMFLIVAFSESILWGLACLFIPFAGLIFLILHWADARKSFLIQLTGIGVVLLGVVLGIVSGQHLATVKP